MYPPGRMYDYANPNFMIAGLLIEKASGLRYRDYMRSRIFEPLGMKRTTFLPSEVLADGDYAVGTTRLIANDGSETQVLPDTYDSAPERPAAYAFSSVLDLTLFARFLLRGDPAILDETHRIAMQSMQADEDSAPYQVAYGFGLNVQQGYQDADGSTRAMTIVWHNGRMPGFMGWMYLHPPTNTAFIILVSSDEDADFTGPSHLALSLFANPPASTPTPKPKVDTSVLDAEVGTYDSPWRVGEVVVTRKGSTLDAWSPFLDVDGETYTRTMSALDSRHFNWTIDGGAVPVTLVPDQHGKPDYFRTRFYTPRYQGPPVPTKLPVPPTATGKNHRCIEPEQG
jgi:hypothetical protein